MTSTARITALSFAALTLHANAEEPEIDLLTGEGVSLGGVIFPHFHAAGVGGITTADHPSQLAGGHHDPQDDLTLQSLEPGLSLRAGEFLEGFATYSAFTDASGIFDGEWEEAFLKFKNIPGGLELRGGRFLNRFGYQNAVHSHSWDYVNNHLLNTRILQEGELITDGGEITWNLPTPFRSALSASYGLAPPHDEGDHGHGHGGADHEIEPLYEGEGARFHDDFFTASYYAQLPYNDFHQHSFNIGGAWGENEFGKTTQIYGIGYDYLWRQNGYEPGGMQFRWRTEVAYRHFGAMPGELHHDGHGEEDHHDEQGEEDHHDEHEEDHHDEHGEEDHHEEDHEEEEDHDHHPGPRDLDEFGIYTALLFTVNDHLETGVRFGYVGGIDDAGLDSRYRVSPNVTVSLNRQRTIFARLQYDYDHSSDYGDSHSGWLQVGFNWGGPEVR